MAQRGHNSADSVISLHGNTKLDILNDWILPVPDPYLALI